MKNPKTTVVVSAYNADRFIAATIRSVLDQSTCDLRLIVVDDGSTDGTHATAIKEIGDDSRGRVVRKPNGGVSSARNWGGRESESDSDFLLFLDADDVLEFEAIKILSDYLQKNPSVGLAFCASRFIDQNGQRLEDWTIPRFVPTKWWVSELQDSVPQTRFVSVLGTIPLIPSVAMIRKSAFDKTNGWDENLGVGGGCHEDTDMALQISLISEIHFVPQVLVNYRRHSNNQSNEPGRLLRHRNSLLAKWRGIASQDPVNGRQIIEAIRVTEGRLSVKRGISAAVDLARDWKILSALRFALGGLRRYILECGYLPIKNNG